MSHRFMYQNKLSSSITITPRSMAQGVVGGAVPRVANGSGGVIFTGPYTGDGQRIYTIEIDLAGDVATATFKWRTTDTAPGAWEATGVLTALTDITLSAGVKVRFTTGAGTDFSLGDRWECTAANRFGKRFLYDLDPDERFRTGTPADPEFVAFDLLTAQEVKAAVAHLHNISSGATTKIQGGPVPQDYSLLFPGTPGNGVDCGDPAGGELDMGTSDFSMCCWFRLANTAGNKNIFIKDMTIAPETGFQLEIEGSGGNAGRIFLRVSVNSASNVFSVLTDAGGFSDDSWHRLVVTVDRSEVIANAFKLYVDGVSRAYSTITNLGNIAGSISNAANFYIGLYRDGSGNPFNGYLDEVSIYKDRILSQADVDADYAGTLSDQSSRIAHWKIDEGSGSAITDTENALVGTLIGASPPTFSATVHSPLDETVTYRAGTMHRYLTTATKTYRYWRIKVEGDSANPDGYIEIGELYLGDYFEPGENYYFRSAPGAEVSLEEGVVTEDGTPRDVLLKRMRAPALAYAGLSDAQVASFRSMFQAVKDEANERNLPLFAHLDATDSGATLGLYRLRGEFRPVVELPDVNSLAVDLLERAA